MAHFLAEVERLEDFDAELHQLIQEIGGGTDVEREIGVGRGGRIGMGNFAGFELALGMVEGQGAQVVGRPVVGADHYMRQRRFVRQYTIVFRKIALRRKIGRYFKGLVRQFSLRHAVEGVDAHLVVLRPRQQIPSPLRQLEGIRTNGFLVALGLKFLVTHAQTVVGLDGTNDGVEVFLTLRHAFQDKAFLDGGTVGQHAVDSKRREEPPLDAVVAEYFFITDVVLIRLEIAVDDDAEHVENGVAMAVE